MEYKEIIFESSDQIAIITLNRPEKLNAYTYQMAIEFWDAIMKVENDPNLRVLVSEVTIKEPV
ncbi:MAG: enoyl-CoA hydratase-related protein, partial [Promethearchaeota archaeon]